MVMAGNRWRGCSDSLYVNSYHNGGQLIVLSYFISVFGNIYHPFLYLGCWEQPCMILGLAVMGFGMVWMDMVWWCMCLGCSTAYQINGTRDGSNFRFFTFFTDECGEWRCISKRLWCSRSVVVHLFMHIALIFMHIALIRMYDFGVEKEVDG